MAADLPSLEQAIRLMRDEEFLEALTLFVDLYGTGDAPLVKTPKAASGLSWFGLAIALVRKQVKPAIDLCRRAIDLEFYNGDHYANLARVYVAANHRRKAIEAADEGLKLAPEHEYLLAVRASLGVRSRPAVPFLGRTNPINVSLGQARHAKRVAADDGKKRPGRGSSAR